MSKATATAKNATLLEFDDNTILPQLFGAHNKHLAMIEQSLDVNLFSRGHEITAEGPPKAVNAAEKVLNALYERLKQGLDVGEAEVDAALRMVKNGEPESKAAVAGMDVSVTIRDRRVSPRSPMQGRYLRAIDEDQLVFGVGPAGTGKTYLAVAKAAERLIRGEVDRIILSRPAVEAGEQLGFLPGDMREKVDPYLRPLYDALYDMLPDGQVIKRMERGEIEVAPLAFMRGRTLSNAFVILDEAQNTTAVQMKMLLTRLGENSRMVVTGDLSQVDLPKGVRSGLRDALEVLRDVKGASVVEFGKKDVVRHPLVERIVEAYEQRERKEGAGARYEIRSNRASRGGRAGNDIEDSEDGKDGKDGE